MTTKKQYERLLSRAGVLPCLREMTKQFAKLLQSYKTAPVNPERKWEAKGYLLGLEDVFLDLCQNLAVAERAAKIRGSKKLDKKPENV